MIRLYLSLLCIAASLTTVTAQPDLPETRREVLAMAGAGVPDTSAYLQALAELAEAAIYVDNLSFARNASMLTAETAKLYGQISPEESARANLVNAKVTYQISRRHPEGIGMAQAALADAREAEHPLLAAEALYHRARFERGVQQPEARIRTLDTLLRLTQGEPELAKWHCYALLEQARDLKETKELDEALVVANRALMNFDRNHPEGSWWALDILGDITSRMGDEGAALDYYNRTVAQYFPDHRTDTAGVLRPVTDELATFFDATTILNHRARFFRRTGRPDLALVDYNTVISFRERQRDANVVESSRMRQSRILMEFYSESISAHYELREADPDHIWEALALSDRVKAYALVSHLANRSVSPDDEKAVELRRHIATLERDQPPGIPLSGELALLELELAEHLEDIRGGNKPIISFDIAQLKKLVADLEGGLLQYSTGYEKAFVFYVDAAGRLSMHEIEDVYNTMYGVFGFRATIEETAYNAKSFRPKSIQDSMDLAFLSQGLDMMRKVLPGIEPDSLPRRLLVIPDQAINFLPFAALPVDSTADPHDYADLRYLIDDHDISYGYSLRHQVQLTGLPDRDKRYDLLAFAPKFRGTANPSDVIAARGAGYPLGSDSVIALNGLAHNVSEAELIATKLPNCRVVAGVEATREAFLAARSESRILLLKQPRGDERQAPPA